MMSIKAISNKILQKLGPCQPQVYKEYVKGVESRFEKRENILKN